VAKIGDRAGVPLGGGIERKARRAVCACETEVPPFDGAPADGPLVGPREHARSRHTSLHRGLELPVERLGLRDLAARRRSCVEPDLTEHERPVTSEMVEARQVAAHCSTALEEDAEREEV